MKLSPLVVVMLSEVEYLKEKTKTFNKAVQLILAAILTSEFSQKSALI
ncbi:MAG: hypothetical protein ACI9XK_004018 [Granulosicoccus sp.]|jgi:hypothetical protein